ncbi:hypothetical protein E1B28_012904 [Marasmius oreades]|uniref:Secreted protein n=1 Tax=Marasmius oreades TaxID=181124 RepID=A0A9P7RSJ2_9AGAR|nr:uncharacterized protein E1B28_012904 [Marasmius oreades]KAG7088959.1 hypothetical protein E1B28_012904 [Marasmius oreades]
MDLNLFLTILTFLVLVGPAVVDATTCFRCPSRVFLNDDIGDRHQMTLKLEDLGTPYEPGLFCEYHRPEQNRRLQTFCTYWQDGYIKQAERNTECPSEARAVSC